MSRSWLVFNLRRRIWWGANMCGYTENVREAGLYTDAEALRIVAQMNGTPGGPGAAPGEGAGDHVALVPAEGWLR